jgi:hypothetical protein
MNSKVFFDSENNFNNKWIETKLKGLQIIDKNEKLFEEKNKVIKTREDLNRSKLKNKSNIDYVIFVVIVKLLLKSN